MANHGPSRIGVIGAGSAGLTAGWFLQSGGAEVSVIDRIGVAGGSSHGNAGWLTPPLAVPLPEPAVLRYGARALLDRHSPLHVVPRPSRQLASFLARFVRSSTTRRWTDSLRHLAELNRHAFSAFDEMAADGVAVGSTETDILAAAVTGSQLDHLETELRLAADLGVQVGVERLTGDAVRALEPQVSHAINAGLFVTGQRTFDPAAFCRAVADSILARGGDVDIGRSITGIHDRGSFVELADSRGGRQRYDAVVVATGTWLGELLRPLGVRMPVQSGRGYSFTLADREAIGRPVYFPAERVVCTPLAAGTRVAGTMEIGPPDAPFRPERSQQIADAIAPLLTGGIGARDDEWCGSRPCSADGLPLVGATSSPRVFVHGGHGMWGMTQSPVTARLLADRILNRAAPAALAPLDPMR